MPGTLRKHLLKFDELAADGLAGTVNSLSYQVAEIEAHLHNYERWYGVAVTPSAEAHIADRVDAGVVAFQIDAGNSTWGAWLQLLGSSDAAQIFDMHRLMITAAERTVPYFVQIGFGATGAAALTAGTYSEFVYKPASTAAEETPIEIQVRRNAAGVKVWARCLALGQNTGTLDFYFGLHYYTA